MRFRKLITDGGSSCVPIRLQMMCGSPRISSPYSNVARPSAAQVNSQTPGYPWTRLIRSVGWNVPVPEISDEVLDRLAETRAAAAGSVSASRARTTRVRHTSASNEAER